MDDLIDRLADIVSAEHVLTGDAIGETYSHDEVLTVEPHAPEVVVRPETSEQVSQVLRLANDAGIPVTARGSAWLPTSAPTMMILVRMEAPISRAISVALISQAVLDSSSSVLAIFSVPGYSAAPVVTAIV